MKLVALIDRGLTTLVSVALVCSFALMLGLAVAQVLLRQVVHATIPWGDLAVRHLVIWVGFFGAYMASTAKRHFNVGFLERLMGPRARSWFTIAADLFAAAVCALLVVAGRTFITVGLDPASVLFLGIRQTTAALIVPVGFGLMTLQFLIRSVRGIVNAIRGEPEVHAD